MSRALLLLVCCSAFLVSLSCTDSSTGPSTPVLTPSERAVFVAKGHNGGFTIIGGAGPIRVKSISDSSIANVNVSIAWVDNAQQVCKVVVSGLNIGTMNITFIDSAGTASVSVPVTVLEMAFEHSEITIQEGSSTQLYLFGGIAPYSPVGPEDDGYAFHRTSGNSFQIFARAAGTTVLTVKDNAPVPNTASVTITITPRPTFTTPGTISFNSNIGDFAAEGIMQIRNNTLANEQGAGGYYLDDGANGIFCFFESYRKRQNGNYDFILINFHRKEFAPGTMTIKDQNGGMDTAIVIFMFDIPLMASVDPLQLSSGTVTLTTFSSSAITGTFSGSGRMVTNGVAGVPGSLTVTNGAFNVPLLSMGNGSLGPSGMQQQAVHDIIRRNLLPERMRERTIGEN